jgi:hypothetical protein
VQARASVVTGAVEVTTEPPGFALHTFEDGALLSQIVSV